MPPDARVVVTTVVVPPGVLLSDPYVVTLLLSADLNSSAPPALFFAPSGAVKGGVAADALVDASVPARSSERKIAAEMGSRPPTIASRIAEPLATMLLAEADSLTPHDYDVIIEIDPRARTTPALIFAAMRSIMERANFPTGVLDERDPTHGYVFATVTAKRILRSARRGLIPSRARRACRASCSSCGPITSSRRCWSIPSRPSKRTPRTRRSPRSARGSCGPSSTRASSGIRISSSTQNLVLPDGLSHRDYLGDPTPSSGDQRARGRIRARHAPPRHHRRRQFGLRAPRARRSRRRGRAMRR